MCKNRHSDLVRKRIERVGFEQIVDFLNANPIKYALTINPTICTSCIEQLWAIVKAKTVNEEVQLHALVDGKKVIITESTIRRDLHLEDAEGVDCLPNATIFEQLTLMGAKTTAWNEFSNTMAYADICLAINQKFNFSKYIFESMVKNLENVSGKFLMCQRFVQVFLEKHLEGMSNHKRIYVTPSHIKKIFGNMRRAGKGFSGRETPLFRTMVKQKPRRPKRKDTKIPQSSGPTVNVADEAVNEKMDDSLERVVTTATSLDAEQDRGKINKTQSKATPNELSSLGTSSGGGPRRQETIQDTIAQTSLKLRVKKLKKKGGSRTYKLKRLYKVGLSRRVESSKDEGFGEEDASKQGRIDDIDANEDIYLVNVHRDEDKFWVNGLEGDEVIVETEVDHEVVVETKVASKDVNLSVDEVTLDQALAALKSAKLKADKVMIEEPEQGTITTTTAATTVIAGSTRSKAKGLVKVQDKVEFDEEERLAREKDEANVALTEEWNDIQAKIDADYQLTQRLQAQEQEKFTDEEKPRLFIQFLQQRRKHFGAKRAEEKRNRPPTRA
ncbi:hypothetical protein Tco_1038684 [Tanacetum coccineum]